MWSWWSASCGFLVSVLLKEVWLSLQGNKVCYQQNQYKAGKDWANCFSQLALAAFSLSGMFDLVNWSILTVAMLLNKQSSLNSSVIPSVLPSEVYWEVNLWGSSWTSVNDVKKEFVKHWDHGQLWRTVLILMSLYCSAISRAELESAFIPYDLKRLEMYSRNMVDYHLIMDMVPTIARMFFLNQLGDISLSAAQSVCLTINKPYFTSLFTFLLSPNCGVVSHFTAFLKRLCFRWLLLLWSFSWFLLLTV